MRFGTAILAVLITVATARAQTAADGQPAADVVNPTPVATASPEPAAPARPRLDEVFRSMQTRAKGSDVDVTAHAVPLGIAGVGFVLMMVALSKWNRVRATRPTAVGNHKKLLKELARATGLSAAQLRRISGLSADAGLVSPIVVAIAPSALRELATRATGDVERMALAKIARQVAKRS